MDQGRRQRHAAAEADDAHRRRILVQQQRQMREQLLRQHVARRRGIDLAVDRERALAGHLLDRYDAGRSFAIVKQSTGFQQAGDVDVARHDGSRYL